LLIIAGPVYVDPEGRDKFVEGHREIVEQARSYPTPIDALAVARAALREPTLPAACSGSGGLAPASATPQAGATKSV
jgi:hypothetical protein